ncbi:hypothetical protein [Erythrobacter sp. BLCC-B19]|uniref:hypothetical protein n=1 Tax=Erythrobacter sp. BLCC-B19 TaxID=3025315 RepID=UPI0023623198|nr:hypothetical protein [Erythrobacter sp. BLCC-B19]WDA41534.1 hypothetical protein PS060_01620 [Erythrobacter sp. BLCC-B19]
MVEPVIVSFLNDYFRLLDRIFSLLFGSLWPKSVFSELRANPGGTIDERLAKIEVAKQNLLEGLSALDELKLEADQNKKTLASALETIRELESKKTEAQEELNALRQVADLDTATLKKLFDVPTSGRIWRERFYGLLTGIVASLIAAYLWQIAFPAK